MRPGNTAYGGSKLAHAGLQAMTPRAAAGNVGGAKPRISSHHAFDEVEKKFLEWISGSSQGKAELWKAWRDIDYNGNHIVSLAEIDKWVVEHFMNLYHKPALMRAYRASSKVHGDDYVHKSEFPVLLRNIVFFNKLWAVFDDMDESADRHLTFNEFRQGMVALNIPDQTNAHAVFKELDRNNGGVVLFDEFCTWVAKVYCPVDSSVYDATTMSPNAKTSAQFKHLVQPQGQTQKQKTSARKDAHSEALRDVEAKIHAMVKDKKKLQSFWRSMDVNGNGLLSLAEIDKRISETYPPLDNSPALIRAYKATLKHGDRDDGFVHKHDFTVLLRNILYFNQCWAVFETGDRDHDRRMTLQEFQGGSAAMGFQMSSSEVLDEFNYMDDGGGKVLFNEFCKWVGQKKMPL
eukprot:CAMPEP_0197628086 /NCGR_PEP_ID=MMETSP1338-20131121/6512_1 /TAXON_ID=43686 ORGANISM="Pelagodinium beii, Strain RCC1491" /NCGR_SAMPLE_ID=MMETSP1338 /ASSEMBLY_ACC=CAM_ASM_000754 /LENGTH=403 /DNA_ID=CAMNT_0043198987 /DNA_START=85 /DNA_END=1296 /DNA_ORIENTATION=+